MPVASPTSLARYGRQGQWPVSAETDFSRGMVRDLGRSSIPFGGVYNSTDYLFDVPGQARKRGGTSYLSDALGATTTGVNFVAAPEFPTGRRIVGLGADGKLYDATSGTVSDRGSFGITTLDNPALYIDRLVVASADGTTAPKKIYVSGGNVTFANLGGSPPAGRLVTSHLSYVVLGSSSAYPNRIWFSTLPDPDNTWVTANYVDFTHSLTAIVPIQGVLLGFSGGATERLTGNIPPGTTGENMQLQSVGQVGCCDARSVAAWGSYVVFASQDGVYVTNGAGFDSLTEKPDGSGIQSYWRGLYSDLQAAGGGIIAGGIFNRNYYFLTISHGSTLVDTLVCYLPRKSWMRVTNIACQMYAPSSVGTDELYGATISGAPGNKILKLSGVTTPTASNKSDANGTAVAPMLEPRMIGSGLGVKAYGHGHLTFDMRDAGSDNPSLKIESSMGVEADTSYHEVPESPFTETTRSKRKRFMVNKDGQALNLRLTQTGASSKTELYAVEVEARSFAEQADGQ